jgi:hypothetical protein
MYRERNGLSIGYIPYIEYDQGKYSQPRLTQTQTQNQTYLAIAIDKYVELIKLLQAYSLA